MERSLHESDDQLELYALDRLPDAAVERIEEHLIICTTCRERLEHAGSFALGMQQALRHPLPLETQQRTGWFAGWRFRWALSGALACAMLLGVLVYRNRSPIALPAIATLSLSAMRGANATAPAAKELDLTLAGAPSGP